MSNNSLIIGGTIINLIQCKSNQCQILDLKLKNKLEETEKTRKNGEKPRKKKPRKTNNTPNIEPLHIFNKGENLKSGV